MKRFTRIFSMQCPGHSREETCALDTARVKRGTAGGKGAEGGRRAEEGDGGGGGGGARGGGFWRVNVFFLFSGIEERVTRARMELFAASERALFKARRTIIIASLIAEFCNKTFCKYKPPPPPLVSRARARSICSRFIY